MNETLRFTVQAEVHQALADQAFARADRNASRGFERAEIQAIHEGRRQQALAEQYRILATTTKETSPS